MSGQGAGYVPPERVDVLLLTASPEEYDAVLAVDTGALPERPWERRMGLMGLEMAFRTFQAGEGTLRVAVTRVLEVGGGVAAHAVGPLVTAHLPRCLAACHGSPAARAIEHRQDVPHRLVAPGGGAEALLDLLRARLPPAGHVQEPEARVEALLGPGTAEPPRRRGPAALLNARHAFVDFFRPVRSALLEDFQSWCDAEAPVSARLFLGASGTGKTRLFIEGCQRLREQGWRAGFLEGAVAPERFEALVFAASERPTCIVIDEAERQPGLLARLQSVARQHAEGGRGRLRLVLLAREEGGWWREPLGRVDAVQALLSERLPTKVTPIAPSEREAAFLHAARSFASLLDRPLPGLPGGLEDPRFERVGFLHMAALASVLGLPFTPETLVEVLLDEEARGWGALQEQAGQAVAALTLAGGAGSREAGALLRRASGAGEEPLLSLLKDSYPAIPAQGESWRVSGLEPDALGEALILRALRKENEAAAWVRRVFKGASEEAVRAAFGVLGRLPVPAQEVEGWVAALLEGAVASRAVAALEAAKEVGLRPVQAALSRELVKALEREGTPEVAARLEAAGLPKRTPLLRPVAAWAMEALLRQLDGVEGMAAAVERARLRHNLGGFWCAMGRREEALHQGREAVAVRRTLAAQHPEVFFAQLAEGISSLAFAQSELGLWEESLASLQEAIGLFRQLARRQPEVFLLFLAMDVNDLGNLQGQLGRREEALALAEEAVRLFRQLAQRREASFPPLAICLSNLGNMQSELGRRQEAFASLQEAVGYFRQLVARNSEVYLPNLAMGLGNLGNIQSELGRRQEALALVQEAVGLYRKLAEDDPLENLPHLATGLNNLGTARSALGAREEALALMQEAVAIRRRLAEQLPAVHLPDLALSLHNLSVFLRALGRREEALASIQEALAHSRRLAEQRPGSFLPGLASGLNNLSAFLRDLGRKEEALASMEEAVAIRRALAEKRPEVFLPDLAVSLHNLGTVQLEVGRREEALASMEEAVALRRTLAQKHPDAYLPDLAMSLANLGAFQDSPERAGEALTWMQEALAIRRTLAERHPEAFLPDLAMSLHNLGAFQSVLKQWKEARTAIEEAVAIRRALARKHPKAVLPELALSLANLSNVRGALGEAEEALALAREALELIWPFFMELPSAFARDTGTILRELLRREEAAGLAPSATLKERMAIWEATMEAAQTELH